MAQRARLLLFAVGMALMAPGVAHAATAADVVGGDDPWAGVEVLEDDTMADMRGGFALPDGQEVNFGVLVTTFAGGVRALETQLTLTDRGAVVEQTLGDLGRSISELTPEERAELGIAGLGGNGVVIEDETGVTALVQNISSSGVQNVVFNTAAGRDLRQEIAVTIELGNFAAMERAVEGELLGMRITSDLGAMLSSGR